MSKKIIRAPSEFKDMVGKSLGNSEWKLVTQEQIDAFASATEDYQWIHIDKEKAKKDSPFKKDNENKVTKTLIELNRSYKKHKDDRFIAQVYEIAFGDNAIKKEYTRDDVLERLMEMSNDSLKVEELKQCK